MSTTFPFPLERIEGPPISLPMAGDRWTIGRGLHCDLVLPGKSVSREHALIGYSDNFWIEDCRSAGGTLVNGVPVERMSLRHGDLVEIGPWQFVYRGEDQVLVADTSPQLRPARLDLLLNFMTALNVIDTGDIWIELARTARSGTGFGRSAVLDLRGPAPILLASDPADIPISELSQTLLEAADAEKVMRIDAVTARDYSQSMVAESVHGALVAGIADENALAACLYLDSRGGEKAEGSDVARFCLALARLASVVFSAESRAVRLWEQRERIYRDLHDDLGARLLGLIHRAPDSNVADEARAILQELRDVVSRPARDWASIDDVLADIRSEMGERCEAANVEFRPQLSDQTLDMQIEPQVATQLIRIFREALSNALKHAGPSVVGLAEYQVESGVDIAMTHDGAFTRPENWKPGRGLDSMRQRAEENDMTIGWQALEPSTLQLTVGIRS